MTIASRQLLASLLGLSLLAPLSACQNQSTPGMISDESIAASRVPDLATGGLTDAEWQTEVSKLNQTYFDAVDANHDGALTLAEAQAVYPEAGLKSLNDFYVDLDTNKDGIWQTEEFSKYMNGFIKIKGKSDYSAAFITTIYLIKSTANSSWGATDYNKDGFITVEELYPSYLSDNGLRLCHAGASCSDEKIIQQAKDGLKAMDANADGKVSYAEYQRHTLEFMRDRMLTVVKLLQAHPGKTLAEASLAEATAAQPAK